MFLTLIQKRRSIRTFADRPIETAHIEQLQEAALRAPSSRGFNPWEFIFVTEPHLLEKLSRAKPHGASFLANAPLGVVVCADPEISDVWVEDAAIATIFIQLAAEDLGLGSCWIQIRKRAHSEAESAQDYIKTLLGIPARMEVSAMVAIGHPREKKPPHPKTALQNEKLFKDRYGNSNKLT